MLDKLMLCHGEEAGRAASLVEAPPLQRRETSSEETRRGRSLRSRIHHREEAPFEKDPLMTVFQLLLLSVKRVSVPQHQVTDIPSLCDG